MASKYDFDKGSYIQCKFGFKVKWSDVKGYYCAPKIDSNHVFVFTTDGSKIEIFDVVSTFDEFKAAYSAWCKNCKTLAKARAKKAEKEKENKDKKLFDDVSSCLLEKRNQLRHISNVLEMTIKEKAKAEQDMFYVVQHADKIGIEIVLYDFQGSVPASWTIKRKEKS